MVVAGVVALAALAAIAAAMRLLPGGDDTGERIRERGSIRIGYALEAPYAVIDDDGNVSGESPFTAAAIAARLGIPRVEWVQTSFDALIPALLGGRIDVVAAGMFVTPERERLVRFSEPTLRVGSAIVVRAGDGARVVPDGRLEPRPDLRIAVIADSAEQQRLLARGWPPSRIVAVPDARAGSAATAERLVDGLALSSPAARWIVQDFDDALDVVPLASAEDGPPDRIAFAFRREDEDLVRAWNEAQRRVLDDPAHLAAIERFGIAPTDVVRPGVD